MERRPEPFVGHLYGPPPLGNLTPGSRAGQSYRRSAEESGNLIQEYDVGSAGVTAVRHATRTLMV